MKRPSKMILAALAVVTALMLAAGFAGPAAAQEKGKDKKPNIVVIMGDDIGIWNIGAYHRGMMAGRTPTSTSSRLKACSSPITMRRRAARQVEPLCHRRAAHPHGHDHGRPGRLAHRAARPGADHRHGAQVHGYATGPIRQEPPRDLNEFLPTVHGFDEFFGYLYHLDAMEDPAHPGYPQELLDKVGPRNMVHSWATDKDDPTVQPRWGKIGKQKIEDAGTLYPKRMETVGRRDTRGQPQVR